MNSLIVKLLNILGIFLFMILISLSTILHLFKKEIVTENKALLNHIKEYQDMEKYNEKATLLYDQLNILYSNSNDLENEYNSLKQDIEKTNNDINSLNEKIKQLNN